MRSDQPPNPAPRPRRSGRWLPERARRDYFDPALADLQIERLQRRMADRTPSARLLQSLWYAISVGWLHIETLRLAAIDALMSLAQPDGDRRDPRKERLSMLLRDLRHALRIFRREPAFAAAAVLTLTLGIGANTALFAVVEAVLLRPLPYRDADALVFVSHRDVTTGLAKRDIAIGDFVDLQAKQRAFEQFAGYGAFQPTLIGRGDPIRVQGLAVTPEIFAVLGMAPAMGRVFTAADLREAAAPVAVVSYELWQTELGSDPAILSRSIQVGAIRRLVVGVAPPGFRFPPTARTDVIVPQRLPTAPPAERKSGWIYGVARLRHGVSIDQAQAELTTLSQQFERDFPQQNQGSLYFAQSMRDALLGDTKRPLLLLVAAVAFVLLIACANVGNLLLARSLSRQHEVALRLALGAGRGRLAMQILAEGVVLALAGGFAGVFVAWRAAPALAAMVPRAARIPGLEHVGLNVTVVGFSFAASIVSALVFNGVACVGLTRDGSGSALAGVRRVTMTLGARRAAASLVAGEIALAVVLLIAAGLTLRSFANLIAVDPGFTPDRVLTLQMSLPSDRYAEQPARSAMYARIFGAVGALEGIESIGAAAVTPLTGNNWTAPLVRPEHPTPAGQRPPEVGWQSASGGDFQGLGLPLGQGRFLDARDDLRSAPVVIVSESLAQRFFTSENAVGQRISVGDGTAEIVGVVGDIRRAALSDSPRADLYYPFERQNAPSTTLFIRTSGDPLAVLPAIRTTVRDLEPNAVLYETRTLSDIAAASAAVSRLAMRLLTGFAAIALMLSAVGIYGVMSYSVRRRTRELGTRLALGASRSDIVRLVMRQAAVLAAIGLGIGVIGGLAAARALSTLLFGVPPWDPLAISAAGAVLTLTALGASYIPAHRAARVDPVCTLATE
jgi:putative ABC transport system permease protein